MESRPEPRLYRGFRDIFASDLAARNAMIERIRSVYERYGYVPLETPTIEYVDVLGKYLPEADLPEGGIFSFRNEDGAWVGLRYDLTAPLSRVVAQYADLPKPFRRYQLGLVFRQEKPGPGRFREFVQFDFDSVGTSAMAADAEVACVMCDALEAAGIARGQYVVKVNNRKVLNGVLETGGLLDFVKEVDSKTTNQKKRVTSVDILRAIDKLDKVGLDGVSDLLMGGRMDQSGDFTDGLQLGEMSVGAIRSYLSARVENRKKVCDRLADIVSESAVGKEGVAELREIDHQLEALGYNEQRVLFDPAVVRGLSYYTGPVFEGELTFEIKDEAGTVKSFGSVFGGGRYDDLVERFTGQKVPATGASIGVDRLLAALKHLGQIAERRATAKVLVTVLAKERMVEYQQMAQELRAAGIETELYVGEEGIGRQLKYADALDVPVAVIAGEDEFSAGDVQIKDLWLGRALSGEVPDRDRWRKDHPAQVAVRRGELVAHVREVLAKHQTQR